MYYGIPTLLELENIEECAKLCYDLGLHFVEINMNLPVYQPDNINTDKLNCMAEKYGIYYTFHLDERFDISDFNSLVSKAYSDTFVKTIDLAKKTKAHIINMHLNDGVYFTLPSEKVYLYEKYGDVYLKSISDFVSLAEKEIGDSGIKITVENTGGFTDFEKKAMDYLLESHVFCLTWDVGHSISSNEKDMEYILAHVSKLAHFHIHDGTRTEQGGKCHQEFGKGDVNLEARIALARECNARCVIETKTVAALKNSVDWLRRNGKTD